MVSIAASALRSSRVARVMAWPLRPARLHEDRASGVRPELLQGSRHVQKSILALSCPDAGGTDRFCLVQEWVEGDLLSK